MSKIPLPERGQPLDLTYIYQIANAINDLASQNSSSAHKFATVDTTTAGTQNGDVSQVRMVGGYRQVATNATVTAGDQQTFSYTLPMDFKYPPVVTATIINTSQTAAGYGTSVVLTNVSSSLVEGIVKFGTNGSVSAGVNIIAIGIAN
jgi:hypothetical protein